MPQQTMKDIPSEDLEAITSRLVAQIQAMDDAELQIIAKSEASLAYFISEAFRSIAALFGYVVALPLAFAYKIVTSIGDGLQEGWDKAWESMR
jgi:hypothetical protein